MRKVLILGALVVTSIFGAGASFANEGTDLYNVESNVAIESVEVVEEGKLDAVADYLSNGMDTVVDFLIPGADASFMSDIATEVGSGATAEVSEVISGPIGSIIFYVLAIFLIGFVVTTITMWVRHKKG